MEDEGAWRMREHGGMTHVTDTSTPCLHVAKSQYRLLNKSNALSIC